MNWNSTIDISVLTNDTDVNSQDKARLIISQISTAPLHGTAIIVGNIVRYTPNLGYFGSDSFYYKCNDLLADSNAAIVNINVINRAPIAVNDQYTGKSFNINIKYFGVKHLYLM
jgi:hypothetical protein